jgi:hypothetical protein
VSAPLCATHPQALAGFRCDGCGKLLCDDCVEESHRLLLCRLCGERALPLASAAPATVPERRQATPPAAARVPYGIGKALLYPFRGSGLFLFVAALGTAGLVTFLVRFSFGCFAIVLWLGWVSLLIGIQFKIVATTARWEDELPDWPEYFSFGERMVEVLTFLAIALLNYGPVVAYLLVCGAAGVLARPSVPVWLGAAAMLWVGTALAVMAWGGAALHWRRSALRIDQHVRALWATGGDGLATVNLTFFLLGVVVVARAVLGERVPLLGVVLGGVVGIYWTFLAPHLVGLLFRRHAATLHAIYES